MQTVLKVQNLEKYYGNRGNVSKAVDNISLEVDVYKRQERNITLTGYSISEYFGEMIELIIQKSTQGVYVNLYLNDTQKHQDVKMCIRDSCKPLVVGFVCLLDRLLVLRKWIL